MAIKLNVFSQFDGRLYQNYWQALGQFMHAFTHVETLLQHTLAHFAGASDQVGRALFADQRVMTTKDTLNKVLVASNKTDVHDRIKPFLDHLGLINSMRNLLIHNIVEPTEQEDAFLITNGSRATNGKLIETPTSVVALQAMTMDMVFIMAALAAEMSAAPDKPPAAPPDPMPWLYKPAAQSSRPKNAKSARNPKPTPPPPPSGG